MLQFEEAKTAEGSNGPLGTRTSGGSESGVAGTMAGVVGSATGEVIMFIICTFTFSHGKKTHILFRQDVLENGSSRGVKQTAHIDMYPKNN